MPREERDKFGGKREQLNEKQQRFVEEYLRTGDAKASAIKAGYSEKGAARTGWQLVHQNVTVKKFLDEARAKAKRRAVYSIESVMEETLDAIKFSKATGNATALVKAVELRAKVQGLIVEKHDVRSLTNLQIMIGGIGPGVPVGNVPALTPGPSQDLIEQTILTAKKESESEYPIE